MIAPYQRYYLPLLQQEVCCRFDSRKPTFSTHFSFEELSSDIFHVTRIKISVPHLKRIFGSVKYDTFPSLHHLDVLAQYIGVKNWEEFVKRQMQMEAPYKHPTPFPQNHFLPSTLEPFPTLPFNFNERQELLFILLLLGSLAMVLFIINF